jgi:type IV pilus assembly protein PilM
MIKKNIGVAVLLDSVKIAVLDNQSSPLVTDVFQLPLSTSNFYTALSKEDEKVLFKHSQEIGALLKQKGYTENEACIVIPDDLCSLQIINLPLVSEKEIMSSIELQAEEFVPYPINKANFDYQILAIDQKEKKMSVLIVVSLIKTITKVADFVLDAGLYPKTIEPESTALYRAITSINNTTDELVLILNIGKQSTQPSILKLSQKQLMMTNSFNIGTNFFTKAIHLNMNLPESEAALMFNTETEKNPDVKTILKPLFIEYGKEVQKIILNSAERIGTIPKRILINSVSSAEAIVSNLAQVNGLANYTIEKISLSGNNTRFVNIGQEIEKNVEKDMYISAIAATL